MLVSFWSVKGGTGVTSVTTMAAAAALRSHREVVLVDLCGELDGFVGDGAGRPGLADIAGVSARGLDDLVSRDGSGLSVLHRGRGRFGESAAGDLLRWVEFAESRPGVEPVVLVDAGVMAFGDDSASWSTRSEIVASSDQSVLVMRPCFLAHRRALEMSNAADWWVSPDSVVCVNEPGRALSTEDIEQLLGVPVVAEVPVVPEMARAIDTGALLSSTPPAVADAVASALGWDSGGSIRPERRGPEGPGMGI